MIEKFWLADPEQKYLISNEMTIADISAACEIATLKTYTIEGFNFEKEFPKVWAWLHRVLAIPGMKEIHDDIIPKLRELMSPEAKL